MYKCFAHFTEAERESVLQFPFWQERKNDDQRCPVSALLHQAAPDWFIATLPRGLVAADLTVRIKHLHLPERELQRLGASFSRFMASHDKRWLADENDYRRAFGLPPKEQP